MSKLCHFVWIAAFISLLVPRTALALEVVTVTADVNVPFDGYGPIHHDFALSRAVSLDGVTVVGIEAFTGQIDASTEFGVPGDELNGSITLVSGQDDRTLATLGLGLFYQVGPPSFGFTHRDVSELSGQEDGTVDTLRFNLRLSGSRAAGRTGRLYGLHDGQVRLHFFRGEIDDRVRPGMPRTHQTRQLLGLPLIEQRGPGQSPWHAVRFPETVPIEGLRVVLQGPQFGWWNSGGPVSSMLEAALLLDDGREIPLDDAYSPSIGEPAPGRGSNNVSLVLDDWEEFDDAEIVGYQVRASRAFEGLVRFDSSILGTPTLYFGYETPPPEPPAAFVRGDCNGDEDVDLSDAVCILNWLFLGGPAPGCLASANTNADGAVDIADPTYLLNYLFLGGPAPTAPFPDCGMSQLEAGAKLACANSSCP